MTFIIHVFRQFVNIFQKIDSCYITQTLSKIYILFTIFLEQRFAFLKIIWYNNTIKKICLYLLPNITHSFQRKRSTLMEKLTPKEQLVYDFIVDTIRREGYSPSVRDIAAAVNMKSTSTVHHYIGRLEEKGYIQKESGKSRTLRIEKAESDTADRIPVLGRVAAGQPILATENFEGYVDYHVNKRRYSLDNLFALIIKGESMIEAGIMNGDTVIVERTSYARNGDIVIALVGDEATCKEFYREEGHYRLQPRNSAMEPILVEEVILLGKVISCYRNYN